MKTHKFVFFGTPEIACIVLNELNQRGLVPSLVVTAPDKPKGRGLALTPTPVKTWAKDHGIPVIDPVAIDEELLTRLRQENAHVFVVVAYGKILPASLINMPEFGTLNVHPSLLPKYRGPSPLQGPILQGDAETGVTIMKLDEKMDHGPIVMQARVPLSGKETSIDLLHALASLGGSMLADTIRLDEMRPTEQDHAQATYTKKISKEDGLVTLDEDPAILDRKWRAYQPWPGLYFYQEKDGQKIRIKITEADFDGEKFNIRKVVPEGKKEIGFDLI